MSLDTVAEHRYKLVAGILLGSLILIVGTIGLSVAGQLSTQTVRLLIAGSGAFGTILLAALTLLTLLDNRELVEERKKDREKPIKEAVVRDVVLLNIERIESNSDDIRNYRVDWTAANDKDTYGFGVRDLDFLQKIDNKVAYQQFSNDYPEVSEKLSEYDSEIRTLADEAANIIFELREPISEYVERRNIENRGAEVTSEDVLTELLKMPPSERDKRFLWWQERHDELMDIAHKELDGDLIDFHTSQSAFLQFSEDVRAELEEVQKEIQSEYGIDIDNNQS